MKKLLLQEITPLVPLEDEKYDNYINRIKQSRENKKYKTVYMEKHHIKLWRNKQQRKFNLAISVGTLLRS